MNYITLLVKFITIYWQPVLLFSSIILTIYLLKWPLIRDVKINFFTYVGAIIYISFYILFFIGLRWVQINKEIDLKNIPDLCKNFLILYNKSFFTQISYTLLIILLVLLWVYIFIKLKEKLGYQIWKIYFYYGYMHTRNEKIFKQHKKISNLYDNFSYHETCYKINKELRKISKKRDLVSTEKWLNDLTNLRLLFRLFFLFLIFIFFFYDCFFHNFILIYTKYYLFFYIIFSLWYKISEFLRKDLINRTLNQIIFEITYCASNVVYINLTEEEEIFLEEYLKTFKGFTPEFYSTFIFEEPPVIYHKRFIYTEVQDIFDISSTGYNSIPYKYVYQNTNTQRYFPPEWLKEKDGKYYTDQEL